jgi:hypothetical protein
MPMAQADDSYGGTFSEQLNASIFRFARGVYQFTIVLARPKHRQQPITHQN